MLLILLGTFSHLSIYHNPSFFYLKICILVYFFIKNIHIFVVIYCFSEAHSTSISLFLL